MASFYDSASIITIPSGYKAGTLYSAKPTDGTGDMNFTRTGDTATRVNSAGIIERCITNALINSENFTAASWTKTRLSVTGDATTAPNGTTTADKLVEDNTNGLHVAESTPQNIGVGGVFSVYVKASERTKFGIREGSTTGAYATFNLSTGSLIESASASNVTITNVGSSWFRIQMGYSTGSNVGFGLFILDDSYVSGSPHSYLYTGNGTSGLFVWGAQLQLGDLATNYIPTTTAAVTEGPVTNLPRLDYLGSTCPQLLMEPTRTNLVTYSQMITASSWTKTTDTSVSGNVVVSPDGYTNADLIISANNFSTNRVTHAFTAVSGTTYAFSAFVKQGPDNAPTAIRMLSSANANLGGINIVFTGGVPAITATGLALNAKAENYGNGWYRISGTYVAPASETNRFAYYADTSGTNKSSYLWGAQVEAGAYATSYIPTTAATVTRNQDQCNKTGITSLLGQSEGTLYHDFERISDSVISADSPYFGITNGSATRLIIYYNGTSLVIQFRVNSVSIYAKTINNVPTRAKIAIGYKLNDLAVYMNGQLIETNALSADFTTYNITRFDYNPGSTSLNNFQGRSNQALVFKTRLTNDELATLTTL